MESASKTDGRRKSAPTPAFLEVKGSRRSKIGVNFNEDEGMFKKYFVILLKMIKAFQLEL